MSRANRWLLPDGVKEVLPPEAARIEGLRRRVVDQYQAWGYDLVMPPLIEYIDSLLIGTGDDLDLATFKVIDQKTGRTMGIRADITPQVARIDAHSLNCQGINRLCYSNTVLHTSAANPLASRSPLQVGAELYGHAGIESDLEVISLMLTTLTCVDIKHPITLDLGHVGIYRGLIDAIELAEDDERDLFNLLQSKAVADIDALVAAMDLSEQSKTMLQQLPRLYGDTQVLDQAQQVFGEVSAQVSDAITYLRDLANAISARFPQVTLYFDLAELRGYEYHTGVVFAALTPAFGQAIAKGGRYDDIGKVFGRARPATGFSADLKILAELSDQPQQLADGIAMPLEANLSAQQCQQLWHTQTQLRQQGLRLVAQLQQQAQPEQCSQQLVWKNQTWVIEAL
ncbi:MAG TPA: ATP phosphoribosyltransferase regulatory subunit [Oceanospirillaceae bacterium]|nr:ATP phosphoribosyltransferase regulatory subunit [Oceanospirillaceae bacterium]